MFTRFAAHASTDGKMIQSRTSLRPFVLALLALVLPVSRPAQAQVAKQSYDTLSPLAFQSDRLAPSQPIDTFDNQQSAVASRIRSAWQSFRLKAPVEWQATVDRRTGLVSFAEGGKVAWIPGGGNSLSLADLAPVLKPESKKVELATLEAIARS